MGFVCKICNIEFKGQCSLIRHLSRKHGYSKEQIKEYYTNYLKKDKENECLYCGKPTKFINGVKGYNKYCPYCIHRVNFPNCKEYWIINGYNEQDAINKAKDIQLQRGLKEREAVLKNPLLHKQKSKFCKEYWLNKGYPEEVALKKISKNSTKASKKLQLIKKDKPWYGASLSLEFWLNKGLNEKEAKQKVKEYTQKHKGRCTKNWHIKKHGETEGLKKYKEYCKTRKQSLSRFIGLYGEKQGRYKWNEYMKKISIANEKTRTRGWSNISQELFWSIYEKIKNNYKSIYFATNNKGTKCEHCNNEYIVRYNDKHFHRLDFYIEDNKKCIEYDDPHWHMNKKDEDLIREQNIKTIISDVQILRISSIDYKKDSDIIIEKCIDFIKEN